MDTWPKIRISEESVSSTSVAFENDNKADYTDDLRPVQIP
jgi:hypothetical protein